MYIFQTFTNVQSPSLHSIISLFLIHSFSDDPSCKGIFSLVYSSSSHLSPPLVDHVANLMDACPIKTFLKSLYIVVSLKLLFRHYLYINTTRWLGAEHLMWWQQISSQIFFSSLLTPFFEVYLLKCGCLLHSIFWVAELQPPTTPLEEVCLLEKHHLFIVISHCPRPINPPAYLTV